MKPLRLAIILTICLAFLAIITLFFDGSFSLVIPNSKLVTIVLGLYLMFVATYLRLVCAHGGASPILLLTIQLLIFFSVVEVGARIWILNFASRSVRAGFLPPFMIPQRLSAHTVFTPHHYTLYNPRPNLQLPDGTRHNYLGMRDHRNFRLRDQAIRIVFIGGSTTYSVGIRDNKRIFSYLLEKLLYKYYQDILPNKEIQVINAGMGGATSAESLLRLIFFVSEIHPDLVVIQHGLNDVWPRMYGTTESDFGNYRRTWGSPNHFSSSQPLAYGLLNAAADRSLFLTILLRKFGIKGAYTIGSMVTRQDAKQNSSFLSTNGTKYFERNTRYMIALCRSMGAKVLISTEAYTEKAGDARSMAARQHNRLLAKIATEEGVLFYDFYSDMIKDDLHIPDGRHVSQIGSEVKAKLFYAFFIHHGIIPNLKIKIEFTLSPGNDDERRLPLLMIQ